MVATKTKMAIPKRVQAEERPSILLVDDEPNTRTGYRDLLCEDNYEVTEATSANEALGHLQKRAFDLIITDWRMRGMDGLQLLEQVRRRCPHIPVLMVTAYAEDVCPLALRGGACACLTKPVPYHKLANAIQEILEHPALD